MKEYFELFWTFAKIGGVTFGGGYAMLPILQRECVDKRGWATEEELTDYFAIGQCTPGIIAVNVSTFIGNKRKGILGGIIATVGFTFFPIVLLSLVAAGLGYLLTYPIVQSAFGGVRVCVCVLIFNAVLKLVKGAMKDAWCWGIFGVILVLSFVLDVSPILYVLAAGLAGVVLQAVKGRGKK